MSEVNTSMPTAEEMAEANDYLKWKEKDTLRTMTSKYNNAVSRFHERIEQLEDNAEKVNQGTQQQFDELDEALGQKFEQITQSLSKKIESVTAADVGLGECDNTSDMDKPVSTAQQQAIDAAIDKFASEFTEEIPDEDPIGDDPEVSGPVKQYIDERIQDAVAHTGIGIASDKVLGGIKASDEIEVDQVTGKATVKGYSDLKKEVSDVKESLNSNNQVTQKVSDNQGDMEELQTEDKTTLVGAINEVFQLGSERKVTLVENLTAMGVTCSITEDWPSLLAKVLTIFTGTDTSEGNLVSDDLLYGKIGFGASGKIIGSMPNRSVVPAQGGQGEDIVGASWPTQAISHSTLTQYAKYGEANTEKLIMRPPTGYYDASKHARVYANPSEVASVIGLTASKIAKGNTILGISGTAEASAVSYTEIDRSDESSYTPTNFNYIDDLVSNGYTSIILTAYKSYSFRTNTDPCVGSLYYDWSDLYNIASSLSSGYFYIPITMSGTTYAYLDIYKDYFRVRKASSAYGFQLFGVKNLDAPFRTY